MRDVWLNADDGTRLYACDAGASGSRNVPLLCLSGLTRNHRDFHPVIDALGRGRRVICADYRGRGQSSWAIDAKTYRADVEMLDALKLLDHLKIERAAVVGVSRGGIVGMV
ncbi:MAG: hypothetical protein RIS52_1912, partial [Pseudomonadota bacterium]